MGLTFVNVPNNEGVGSLYRETSRGVNLPTELRIRHRDITDSRTKRAARESTITVNRWAALTDGTIAIVASFSKTVRCIKDATITDAHLLLLVDIGDQLCNDTDADASALDKRENIYVTQDA
jgi:hypothetical protein